MSLYHSPDKDISINHFQYSIYHHGTKWVFFIPREEITSPCEPLVIINTVVYIMMFYEKKNL